MKKAFFAGALFIAGCASHGVMVNEQQLQQFERGKTTERDVIASLGQPTSIMTRNGQRTLVYSGAQAQARPASFIPFIGPLVGGYDMRASSVVFNVSPTGIITDITSSQSATGGGQGFAAGAPIEQIPDQPRKP